MDLDNHPAHDIHTRDDAEAAGYADRQRWIKDMVGDRLTDEAYRELGGYLWIFSHRNRPDLLAAYTRGGRRVMFKKD